jgi:hypothetical protein
MSLVRLEQLKMYMIVDVIKKSCKSEVPDQPESFFKRRPVSRSARFGSRRRQLNTGADTLNRERSDKVCGPETNSLDCYKVLHRYSIPVRRIRIRIRIWNSEDAKSWRIRIRIRDPSLRSRAQYTRHSLEGTEIDQSFKKTLPIPALRNLTISLFSADVFTYLLLMFSCISICIPLPVPATMLADPEARCFPKKTSANHGTVKYYNDLRLP